MGRVVLVTGISRDIGRRFARSAASDPSIDRVIGVDVVPPRGDIGDVSFVRADIRTPVIAKVLAKEDVDTVVHMSVIATPGSAGGRNTMKELNVMGTMQLLAACQKAPNVEQVVVKSTTTVYGASSRDPAMFTEEMGPKRAPLLGLRQGRLRGRGLRPRLRAAPARRRGDDDPRRERDRSAREQPDDQLLPAAGRPAGAGLRPAPAVPPRGRPARRAQARGQRRHARHLQRRRPRHADALPGGPSPGQAVGRPPGGRGRPPRLDPAPGPDGGLLARADRLPDLRSRGGHHADAHRARLRAALHHRIGLRRLRCARWASRGAPPPSRPCAGRRPADTDG